MKNILLSIVFLLAGIGITQAKGYEVGDKVEDFNLQNINGSFIGMKDFPDAKGFILIFSCNHCPYVKATEERIEALHKEFAPKGYPVIAINSMDPAKYPDDSFDNMVRNAQQKGFSFFYVFDDGQKVYPVYGATKTPEVFIVQKEGDDYILKYHGAIDDNVEDAAAVKQHFAADAVNALLAGEAPEPATTKAIGCTIM